MSSTRRRLCITILPEKFQFVYSMPCRHQPLGLQQVEGFPREALHLFAFLLRVFLFPGNLRSLAKKQKQPKYNVALADVMHPPRVIELDASGYSGKAGEVIRVQAEDNVRVTRVPVAIQIED